MVVAVRVMQMVGVNRVVETARKMGIKGKLQMVPSLALGAADEEWPQRRDEGARAAAPNRPVAALGGRRRVHGGTAWASLRRYGLCPRERRRGSVHVVRRVRGWHPRQPLLGRQCRPITVQIDAQLRESRGMPAALL